MDKSSGAPENESYLLYKAIFPMGDECLSCEEVFDMIAAYVEQHVEQEDLVAHSVYEMISEHLGECSGCMEIFKSLHYIYRLEKAGLLPQVENLPETGDMPKSDPPASSSDHPAPSLT
ncbi:MAG: hypothetical protein HY326_03410 [Chloroflexi bacterium]|nr:hypothetical protein [Chloroflexota bacterium]